jgi:CHASE2 domain-containing sensor protein
MQFTGALPPNLALGELHTQWQQFYGAIHSHQGLRQLRTSGNLGIEIDQTDITNISESEFRHLCQDLHQTLNTWLDTKSFRHIDRQLRTRLHPEDEIRLIITAENRQILQLPWGLWQFCDDYLRAEIALSLPEYTLSLKAGAAGSSDKVRILAILGNSQGIDVRRDQQILEQMPDAELQFLIEPDLQTLHQHLWQANWDILFFAGHSSSQGKGRIQLNQTDNLSLDQLKYSLRKAIERGLKLAIFNSCDGLELAWDLADLRIPQVIVMREPVPDRVAQEFLKHFLVTFSSGQSLYLAVREAREHLQSLELEFPCATWLPTICQNPAELPPLWQDWAKPSDTRQQGLPPQPIERQPLPMSPPPSRSIWTPLRLISTRHFWLSSVLATGLVIGLRSLGLLQPFELWAYDRLLTLRPVEPADSRLLIVKIDEADIQAQNPNERRGSLSDRTLQQAIQLLTQAQARVIGLDIYRDFPTQADFPNLVNQLEQNDRLVVVCKSRDARYDPTGVAPPPEVPEERVGFSDFLFDQDGILRRQLLTITSDPASPCTAPYASSARLAFRYLQEQGITVAFTPDGNLKLGEIVFHRLHHRTGGYQGIDARGNQILLNYRALPPQMVAPQVSLNQLLQGQINPESIRDRLVLIGVTATSGGDFWSTPYGTGVAERVPGVFLQAQMTSQMISAVLDQRPLITVWPGAGEILWIWVWSAVGGLVVMSGRSPLYQSGSGVLLLGTISGLSLLLLMQGSWVPLVPSVFAILFTVGIAHYHNSKIST